ncbi:phospholipase D-like domain-containing protein [Mangrovibacterium diazotrophicum]|uniref:phospholipase D n=1 Tax=Mangrovibacterium diazotrophicum TaxID=1261403 RepID=A0A419W5W1_9BACT|nr:phospholipase D-like domain-containing protein [Mangrovibacterium diazotrophicum]RKD90834.1 phosphatidylserine/phosphatidylglycerophosphate/cardiolipin synthase-like enzyme [Mangrovibacterium diazotrophicum]
MGNTSTTDCQVKADNPHALFTLVAYRGEGMLLLAMNWKAGEPPKDFVGFSIEYKEPNGYKYYALKNRLSFLEENGKPSKESISSLLAPFQKFRWIHFPRNANMKGNFTYRVSPVFMNINNELSYGEPQIVSISLSNETYPNKLNVTFTRGFVSSQAFVNRYESEGGIPALLPTSSKIGLDFTPTHPKAQQALAWMGFEATEEILKLLDDAIDDEDAEVRVVAYDINQPDVLKRLIQLGPRLKIIIDNSGEHGKDDSAETKAMTVLMESAHAEVKRHHMSGLQHNKTIVIDGPKVKAVICGSTNFTWRGFYVQANNAVIMRGAKAIKPFMEAFEYYWQYDKAKNFGQTQSAQWTDIALNNVDVKVSFSPHSKDNALLDEIAHDIEHNTNSSLFYSLAFLYQTSGSIRNAVTQLTNSGETFIYGVSDKEVGGLDLQKPDGSVLPVYPSVLSKNLPEPFKSEPTGGRGTRMHHKFVVIDFDRPTARVYFGSYNFSPTADTKNGENLLLIKDQRIAVSYMIEALRIFDHYHFRVAAKESQKSGNILFLQKPPKVENEKAWWEEYYTDKKKIKDRLLFSAK